MHTKVPLKLYTTQTTWPEYNKLFIPESNIFKLTSNWFPPLDIFFFSVDYPINNKRLYVFIVPKVKKNWIEKKKTKNKTSTRRQNHSCKYTYMITILYIKTNPSDIVFFSACLVK